jgi:hypothetical protein
MNRSKERSEGIGAIEQTIPPPKREMGEMVV